DDVMYLTFSVVNPPAFTYVFPLSLHDALPISRFAPPLLRSTTDHAAGGRNPCASGAGTCVGLCGALRQLDFGRHVQGHRRRLSVGRAAENRRTLGIAFTLALRPGRESATTGGSRCRFARHAHDRQRKIGSASW